LRAGNIVVRSHEYKHRMVVDEPCWTLFITGPSIREWGFWCPGGRFVPWQEFTEESEGVSSVGRGCGEA